MSNFTGVTFAQQKVLPSDDAIVRRSLLSDGILYGCDLSYSGSTLTMAEGQILICGRQIRHPSPQNWAVVDATSGFARLILTVDLTKTSTKEVFEQVIDSIEYASSVDGFPELEQTNVNLSGTRYQVVGCVVSLGTGGITGIVSQMGPCEATGGGGLNFSVVGGLTQPTGPAENMIWVSTDVPISSYIFSTTEPEEAEEGMVWITTGISSSTEFNALKKNGIQVYPMSAKQYISGAWVDVTAKSYQGGAWVDWIKYLYKDGNEYSSISAIKAAGSSYSIGTLTKNSSTISLSATSGKAIAAILDNPVDLTNYRNIAINAVSTGTANNASAGRVARLNIFNVDSEIVGDGVAYVEIKSSGTTLLPIDNLVGEFIITVRCYVWSDASGTASVEFDELSLRS